jgi:hypothetical protein
LTLWVTHDVGQTWSRVALPAVAGTLCEVDAAADGSPRLVMRAYNSALDQNPPGCAHTQFFLSDDNGATWRAIAPNSLPPAVDPGEDCGMFATGRHLFLATRLILNDNSVQSTLERSDDDGQTWQRADHGLPDDAAPQPLDGTGETLIAFDTPYDAAGRLSLWMSPDAGANWRPEAVTWPTPPRGSGRIEDVLTEAPLGVLPSTPQACHCVIGVSYPNSSQGSPSLLTVGEHLYLSQGRTQWTQWRPLPPLPVKGASAERSGVYRHLGLTSDGRLLVLGADPDAGVGGLPRLWAWNTHTGRWELAPTQLPCHDLQSCFDIDHPYRDSFPAEVSVRHDANGQPTGTSLWFILGGPWYRLSSPAS